MTRRRSRSGGGSYRSKATRAGTIVGPGLGEMHRFNTIADFLAAIPVGHDPEWSTLTWRFGYEDQSADDCRRALVDGVASQATLDAAARVRDSLEAAVDDLDMGEAVLRKIVRGTEGDDLDTGRYVEGRDDCWVGIKRRKVLSRIVRIGINTTMSCGTSVSAWTELLGTAAALCDILTRLGFGVEIVGMAVTSNRQGDTATLDGWCGTAWTVKRSDDPMDLEAVASMGRPGLCRWAFASWAVDRGLPSGGSCHFPTACVKEWAGVDYLLTHSWVGKDNRQILEAVREVIASAQEPAAV